MFKVRKRADVRYRYNQAPHQDTNGKVTTSQLDVTNERQEFRPFPAGDHMASINRRVRKHNENKTEIKEAPPWNGQKNILLQGLNLYHGEPTSPLVQMWIKAYRCLVCMKTPNLSMHHVLKHINQDIKMRQSKDNDSIVK